MNILHLHEWASLKGGAEVYISDLVAFFPEYGCTAHWVGIRKTEHGQYQVSEYLQENTICFDTREAVCLFLADLLHKRAINLINIHNFFLPEITDFCLKKLPVVRSAHGPQLVCPGNDKFWRKSERICNKTWGLHCLSHIYTEGCANRHPKRVWASFKNIFFEHKTAINGYHTIMVMSEYIRQEYIKGGVPAEKIVLNPYFTPLIDAEQIIPTGSHKRKSLLFMGRLISTKGVHIMIESLLPLLQEREDIQLDIVGDGIMRAEIEAIIAKSGLTERIILHGWKNKQEISLFLQNAHIVFFPSIYPEAFGLVGIEAMMYAKPVIAFDVGGVSTWLKHQETGFLIPLKNKEAMLQAAKTLINDAQIYEKMSIQARSKAQELFVSTIHLSKLLNIYKQAILE